MSKTKKTWKEKVIDFMQENAAYFASISALLSGSDYVPFN